MFVARGSGGMVKVRPLAHWLAIVVRFCIEFLSVEFSSNSHWNQSLFQAISDSSILRLWWWRFGVYLLFSVCVRSLFGASLFWGRAWGEWVLRGLVFTCWRCAWLILSGVLICSSPSLEEGSLVKIGGRVFGRLLIVSVLF
ncbi:hypothetical protein LIER_31588 [Lithospermum erythrorhizon]|uniref:Transmembrane protein n=1 Tax=Lithospermum erythrorhizon TaxID=34254 RepID=A0AAV3RTV7_LITER